MSSLWRLISTDILEDTPPLEIIPLVKEGFEIRPQGKILIGLCLKIPPWYGANFNKGEGIFNKNCSDRFNVYLRYSIFLRACGAHTDPILSLDFTCR